MAIVKAGTQVQGRALTELAGNAGAHDAKELVILVAICLAESEGYERAYTDTPDGRKVGLWQIKITKSQIGEPCEEDLYNGVNNAEIMYDNYKLYGLAYWDSFKSKVYLNDTYIQRASLGVMNFLAEMLVNDAKAAGKTPATRVPMITLNQLNAIYRKG